MPQRVFMPLPLTASRQHRLGIAQHPSFTSDRASSVLGRVDGGDRDAYPRRRSVSVSPSDTEPSTSSRFWASFHCAAGASLTGSPLATEACHQRRLSLHDSNLNEQQTTADPDPDRPPPPPEGGHSDRRRRMDVYASPPSPIPSLRPRLRVDTRRGMRQGPAGPFAVAVTAASTGGGSISNC